MPSLTKLKRLGNVQNEESGFVFKTGKFHKQCYRELDSWQVLTDQPNCSKSKTLQNRNMVSKFIKYWANFGRKFLSSYGLYPNALIT